MTKSTPSSSPTRRVTRGSRIATDNNPKSITKRTLAPAKESKTLAKQIKKTFHPTETMEQSHKKHPIVSISDFNKRSGITMYLVRREGIENDAWETEDSIENLEVLSAYQQKVQADSGYLINQSQVTEPIQEDDDPMIPRKRPARLSKIRAVMALKQPVYDENDDDDDDEKTNRNTKRKSIKSGGDTGAPANKRSGSSRRKTKVQILMEAQAQERLERKKRREQLDGEALICSLNHVQGKDCCLMCASNTYRELLQRGDLEGFKANFEDRENIPSYTEEDKPNGLDLISYAIILEKFDFAEYAEKTSSMVNEEVKQRPVVPRKNKVYDDHTGHNRGIGAYSNRAFRQVQESRGNRLGNSAFYRQDNSSAYPRKSYMNVEDNVSHCSLRNFLPYISKDIFQRTDVVENCVALKKGGSIGVYIAVMAGNRLLASKLLEYVKNVEGRSTFNHLHEEILKFNEGETLTNYRRPQIIKMASDACNINPYHCAAIHPSATYLTEFYEALDAAERLETDSFGRSVAFYAAVSETTACLEFLISKNFNLTMHDKYKMTPLIQAARFGRSLNVELLIKFQTGNSNSSESSPAVFQSLLRNRRTAMHYAAYFGHADTCKILIKYGASVEPIENLDKQTPLHFAAKNGYLECVRVLIEEGGANPEKGDKFAKNALHLACIYGHLDIVHYLLSIGVDADSSDSSQNSPAHYAAAYGYIKILHLLIAYGSANPATTNVWRSTPCSVANMKGHLGIVKYLLQLPGNPIDVNFKDPEGMIMLQHAISEPVSAGNEMETNLKKTELLLSMDADVNSIDIHGCTPMHTLAKNVKFVCLIPKGWASFYPSKMSNYYNNYFAIITTRLEDDMDGIEYHIKLANLLIERGADLNIKNVKGETPLLTAMENGHYHLAATLLEAGSKFWIDTDEKGDNFFHHYGYLVARLGYFQPHCSEDAIRQERLISIANRIWNIIESKLTDEIDLKDFINAKNDKGQSPLVQGLLHAIATQKLVMIREKRLINCAVPAKNQYGNFGYNNNTFQSSEKYKKHTEVVDVDLRFNFAPYIEFTQKLIDKTKPDMNSTIGLPKEFKEKNPKAKRSEYPALTDLNVLHIACQTQSADLVKFLLKNGANPNARVNIDGWLGSTAFLTVYHEKKDGKQELPDENLETLEFIKKNFRITKPDFKEMLNQSVQVLLEYGACPFITNASGDSPLFRASANMDVTNLQLMCNAKPSKDTNVNAQNVNGQTALMTAIDSIEAFIKTNKEQVEVSVVKSLLQANANPNVKYDNGDTVLIKAIKISHLPLVQSLLENTIVPIDHSHQNNNLEMALTVAAQLNDIDIVQLYLENLTQSLSNTITFNTNTLDEKLFTPLSYACKNGNFSAVKMLISLGANPNICKPQSVPLIEAIKSGNIQIAKLLLETGATVTECDIHGNSPLHNAVLVEKHRIVDVLLDYSADVNMYNNKKQTPLHLAIERTKKQTNRSLRIEFSLIKKGANLNAVDFFGRTPLHYVFVDSDLIPITRNTAVIKKKVKQISQEIKVEQEKQRLFAEYNSKYDLNEYANSNQDHATTRINNWMRDAKEMRLNQTLKEKLAANKNSSQETVVLDEERDVIKGYYSYGWETENIIPERFDPIDILKHISDCKDVQFDLKDEFGRTPLHYAACVGAFSCTTLLIEKNVDINAIDTDNNGPLQLALRNNYVDYSVMLCNFGASVKSDIVLKDGKSTSNFGFSLSKSLINVAYLIMDKGILLIVSIRDALKNGKFHMAEILLQSAEDQALSETLAEEGQNIWHVIANFKPFDNEIWQDYLEDIIKRLDSLNLKIYVDKYGRSPLHYAAKHGQSLLLQHFIGMTGNTLNLRDQSGETEMDYAVLSGEIECVKTLLAAGSKVIKSEESKNKSLLLKAVENSRFDIAELVLSYGALTDDQDSLNGFANSVMVTCQTKNFEMLELLIKYGADLNIASQIERKDKKNRAYKVMIHPIFIASTLDKRFLETMLKGGADPNVVGPKSKPEYGRSCFMYNVSIRSIENQKMLLEHNVDINAFDEQASRTIFYQFFFNKVSQYKAPSGKQTLRLDDSIYENMIQLYQPQVDHIDTITGMTPLELAIHEKNEIIVERLLLFGANVNTESCDCTKVSTIYYNAMNPFGTSLPAVLHAITRGNLNILKLVCEKYNGSINWLWNDIEGNNMLSYATGSVGGYSHSNITILQYIKEQMKQNTFTKLLQQNNHCGVSPITSAYHRENKELYNSLLDLNPILADFAAKHYNKNAFQAQDESSLMDIDYISTQKVDEDAQIERERLQKLKNIQNASKKTTSSDIEEDESLKVDAYSKLEKVGSITLDENNVPYNIMLMKVELQSWGSDTDTSIYKLSIIYNKVLNVYILWTRWGPFGQEGQHQKTPFLTKEEAVTEFKSIFKSKTGNAWDLHRESFETKPGRYEIMKIVHHPRDIIIENFDFLSTTVPSELPLEVSNIMKLICNYTYLSRVYNDTNVDMPLGQIPQKRIEEARQILKDTYELIKTYSVLKIFYSDRAKIQESKVYAFRIAQNCVEYSRIMPRNGEANKSIRSLYNHDNSAIFGELSKIEDLSYVGFAANVILAAKHHVNSINPLDYAYHTLNCSLQSISPTASSSEYQLIKRYMDSTASQQHELVHLFAVNRADEDSRFRPFENEPDRKLLWHGSRVGNFMGIMKQGLRVTPRTSSVINGAMLGNGVYFADTFAKSLNYSSEYYGDHQSTYRIMLLCEVALGSRQAVYQYGPEIQTENLDSMKGEGSNIPDPDNTVYDTKGLCIPLGPCIPYVRPALETPNHYGITPLLNHNEYAVYNEDRVKIRYLLIIKESNSCALCTCSGSNLKPLSKHDLSDYKLVNFNSYEAELTKAYLLHTNNTAQSVYNEDLDTFIETGLYKKKWNIPLDLKKQDKVCDQCTKQAVTMMLEKRMTGEQNSIDVFELLNRKPQCKYGKECRTQNTVSHAKKYKHWFAEKISEDLEKGPSSDKVLDQNHGPTQEDQDLMDTEDEDSMDTDDSDADDNMII